MFQMLTFFAKSLPAWTAKPYTMPRKGRHPILTDEQYSVSFFGLFPLALRRGFGYRQALITPHDLQA